MTIAVTEPADCTDCRSASLIIHSDMALQAVNFVVSGLHGDKVDFELGDIRGARAVTPQRPIIR